MNYTLSDVKDDIDIAIHNADNIYLVGLNLYIHANTSKEKEESHEFLYKILNFTVDSSSVSSKVDEHKVGLIRFFRNLLFNKEVNGEVIISDDSDNYEKILADNLRSVIYDNKLQLYIHSDNKLKRLFFESHRYKKVLRQLREESILTRIKRYVERKDYASAISFCEDKELFEDENQIDSLYEKVESILVQSIMDDDPFRFLSQFYNNKVVENYLSVNICYFILKELEDKGIDPRKRNIVLTVIEKLKIILNPNIKGAHPIGFRLMKTSSKYSSAYDDEYNVLFASLNKLVTWEQVWGKVNSNNEQIKIKENISNYRNKIENRNDD